MGDFRMGPKNPGYSQQPIVVQPSIDVEALALAIVNAMKLSGVNLTREQALQVVKSRPSDVDDFDNTASLEKLATSMFAQRGTNKANFEELGKESRTVSDKGSVQKTIDLLRDID